MTRLESLILTGLLTGGLMLISAPARAQANPPEPRPGTTQDIQEDKTEIGQARAQVQADQQQLAADEQQFGQKSPQVRADRARLKRDRHHLRHLRRDINRDRDMREDRREERGERVRGRR
jgi:septal ring factor EnvC (AmiA/AmiB activator)